MHGSGQRQDGHSGKVGWKHRPGNQILREVCGFLQGMSCFCTRFLQKPYVDSENTGPCLQEVTLIWGLRFVRACRDAKTARGACALDHRERVVSQKAQPGPQKYQCKQ